MNINKIISAMVYSLCLNKELPTAKIVYTKMNAAEKFVQWQVAELPPLLQWGVRFLIFLFASHCKVKYRRAFTRLTHSERSIHLNAWRFGWFQFQTQFIRLIESLATVSYFSPASATSQKSALIAEKTQALRADVAHSSASLQSLTVVNVDCCVIGSGPGGSLTAATLAQHGKEVLLLEEGDSYYVNDCSGFSLEEMIHKYRNHGILATLGQANIMYAEGNCLGGGSEINSGLYHRTPPEILALWQDKYDLQDVSWQQLEPHFIANEQRLSVGDMPEPLPAASLKLLAGAEKLNWKAVQVPRWFTYETAKGGTGGSSGIKQSMTQTYLADYLKYGGKIITRARAERLQRKGDTWSIDVVQRSQEGAVKRIKVVAKTVFLGGGTIQTPALLQKSGLSKLAGRDFQLHPTLKITASFPETINFSTIDVPVHQVKEFAPRLSFGCSISTLPHLALSLLDYPDDLRQLKQTWHHMAIYYAMLRPQGTGQIRVLPGVHEPLVTYRLTAEDYASLREGLMKLAQLLQAAGATELYPSLFQSKKWSQGKGVPCWEARKKQMQLMTIHLFSSCPMGENRQLCTTNSYGQVHDCENLYVADGSLLPTALGVNPQGTILALVRRNVLHYLGKL